MTSIVLTMIVKDEAPVIGRCLGALKPHIDHAVIIDTGSTDNTIDIIKEVLPEATIGHDEFISFRHNRTKLLELARETYPDADYHLMIDADDTFVPQDDFKWPELNEDCYLLEHRLGSLSWWRPQVFRASKPFYYGGVAHEALSCDVPFTSDRLKGLRIQCGSDGARRRKEPLKKYQRVAAQLQKDHDENPSNRRTVFYLAQSYRDCLQREKALRYYELRVSMGGWAEEVWYSKYQVGRLREMLGFPTEAILSSYLDAFRYRPSRSEPLFAAASLCRRTKQRGLQLMHAAAAIHIPYPKKDRLFVEWPVYAWRAWDEFAMACWHHDRMEDGIWANFQILKHGEGYPPKRILDNITHCCRPKDKFDLVRKTWEDFLELPANKRNANYAEALFTDRPDLDGLGDKILDAIHNGGGFPK